MGICHNKPRNIYILILICRHFNRIDVCALRNVPSDGRYFVVRFSRNVRENCYLMVQLLNGCFCTTLSLRRKEMNYIRYLETSSESTAKLDIGTFMWVSEWQIPRATCSHYTRRDMCPEC